MNTNARSRHQKRTHVLLEPADHDGVAQQVVQLLHAAHAVVHGLGERRQPVPAVLELYACFFLWD